MRLVFMGTPQFAVPTLEAIVNAGHEVLAVYTQPDRPSGRGQTLAAPPVKQAALKFNLPVFQPERIRRPENVQHLSSLGVDAMVVVGYGQIIPQSIIDLAPHGILNVHASLLPKYRGAGPIQWAIANGESITGVTIMRIDAGLDTGDMLRARETAIGENETAIELGNRLSTMGAALLVETLARIDDIRAIPQNNELATHAPILKKEDGRIDWNWPAAKIHNRVRGFLPWPGGYTTLRGSLFHIWAARTASTNHVPSPGAVSIAANRLVVGCGEDTSLEMLEVQLEGRKKMPAQAFLNGFRLGENEMLGEESH